MASDESVFQQIGGELSDVVVREQRIASRRRRILLALLDLGFLDLLGPGQISVTDTGLVLGTLDDAGADALARRLEDLAVGATDATPHPFRGQLGLDFEPVAAPAPLRLARSPHPVVFR